MSDELISFIIPCYKSEKTVETVIDEIIKETGRIGCQYEIICVDDCSPDNVYEIIRNRASSDPWIKGIQFAKNFGQHAGMIAGAQNSTGKYLVFLDDDGQCPLDHLSELLTPLRNGWDIAIAEYGKKKQSRFKNFGSMINEIAANLLIDKPKNIQMGNFVAAKRFIIKEISKYNGPYPYISGLLFRSSAKVINVPMEERWRMEGRTTYTFKKLVELWISSFTAFSIKPLRLATFLGMFSSILGIAFAIYIVVNKIINPQTAAGWSSIMAVNLVLGGLILFVLGIMGEYLGRIYMSISDTPQYVVRTSVNLENDEK